MQQYFNIYKIEKLRKYIVNEILNTQFTFKKKLF